MLYENNGHVGNNQRKKAFCYVVENFSWKTRKVTMKVLMRKKRMRKIVV